jgi:hypothetical protein
MPYDLPKRDPAKVKALAKAVRDMTAGMRTADVVQALASVITTAVATRRETATRHGPLSRLWAKKCCRRLTRRNGRAGRRHVGSRNL